MGDAVIKRLSMALLTLVLMVPAVSYFIYDHYTQKGKSQRCSEALGIYVKTWQGYACIAIEEREEEPHLLN